MKHAAVFNYIVSPVYLRILKVSPNPSSGFCRWCCQFGQLGAKLLLSAAFSCCFCPTHETHVASLETKLFKHVHRFVEIAVMFFFSFFLYISFFSELSPFLSCLCFIQHFDTFCCLCLLFQLCVISSEILRGAFAVQLLQEPKYWPCFSSSTPQRITLCTLHVVFQTFLQWSSMIQWFAIWIQSHNCLRQARR